jgi:hypothetical protein
VDELTWFSDLLSTVQKLFDQFYDTREAAYFVQDYLYGLERIDLWTLSLELR